MLHRKQWHFVAASAIVIDKKDSPLLLLPEKSLAFKFKGYHARRRGSLVCKVREFAATPLVVVSFVIGAINFCISAGRTAKGLSSDTESALSYSRKSDKNPSNASLLL